MSKDLQEFVPSFKRSTTDAKAFISNIDPLSMQPLYELSVMLLDVLMADQYIRTSAIK
jgi:hypothetical protein